MAQTPVTDTVIALRYYGVVCRRMFDSGKNILPDQRITAAGSNSGTLFVIYALSRLGDSAEISASAEIFNLLFLEINFKIIRSDLCII